MAAQSGAEPPTPVYDAARPMESPAPAPAEPNGTVTYQVASVRSNAGPRPSSAQIRHMNSLTQAPVYDSITFVSGSAVLSADNHDDVNTPIYASVDKAKKKRQSQPLPRSPSVAERRGGGGLSISLLQAAPRTVTAAELTFDEPVSPGSPRQVSII